jgi:hypothetical protein
MTLSSFFQFEFRNKLTKLTVLKLAQVLNLKKDHHQRIRSGNLMLFMFETLPMGSFGLFFHISVNFFFRQLLQSFGYKMSAFQ